MIDVDNDREIGATEIQRVEYARFEAMDPVPMAQPEPHPRGHGALGLVGLDERCWEDSKGRSYRTLLKKASIERVVGKKPDGTVVEFVPRKGLAAALKEAGHDFKKAADAGRRAAERGESKAQREAREKAQAQQRIEDEVERRALLLIARRAAEAEPAKHRELRRLAAHALAQTIEYSDLLEGPALRAELGISEKPAEPKKKRGAATYGRGRDEQLHAWIDEASYSQLEALYLLIAIADNSFAGLDDIDNPFPAACSALEIDPKAITAEVKADLKRLAAAAPSGKASKAKPAKKPRAKKRRGCELQEISGKPCSTHATDAAEAEA